jgi:hypothetical protein
MGSEMRDNLQLSERLYGLLLYLYPKPFRARYGQHMRLTFRDACRGAYHRDGVAGLVALWLPTLLDLFKSVLEVWARQGEITMLKARLIALAGPLTILVGLLWIGLAISDILLRTGVVGEETALAFWSLAFMVSFIPLLFALIGSLLRFYPSVSLPGRVGLLLSVAGGTGVILAVVASLQSGGAVSGLNYTAVASLLSIRLGYILFGIDVWRYKLLPRWNLLPLLVGLTVVLSLPFDWFGVPAIAPSLFTNPFLHFASTGACWLLLGMAMMEQRQAPRSVATI